MSFILDALKKLEQKRQRGSVPDLMTIHMPESRKPRKRPVWPYLVLAALILNAGILISWLRPWGTEKENTTVGTAAAQKNKQDTRVSRTSETISSVSNKKTGEGTVERSGKDEKQNSQAQKTELESAHKQPASSLSHTEQKANLKTANDGKLHNNSSSKTSTTASLTPPSPAPDSSPTGTTRQETPQDIPELSRLPLTVQAEIPPLAVMGHIYSDSSVTRMVNINGDILREGDTAAENIRIEEITENGVIFNYNGLRFRLRAF